MEKTLGIKIIGIVLVALLVANLLLMAFRVYGEIIFWTVIVVVGGGGWIFVKKLNSPVKKG